jgi:phosphoribosylanthranilate isomerase
VIHAKICGLCRPEDAALAARAGADYLGVILAAGFRRSQSIQTAERIFAAGPGPARVGVMIDPTVAEALEAQQALNLDVIQLHGDELPALVRELSSVVAVWKAVRVRSPTDVTVAVRDFGPDIRGLLLDAHDPATAGGSGRQFDWAGLAQARRALPQGLKVIVAGGLTPHNVAQAIAQLHPDVVDVSSGVETAIGSKSSDLIHSFIHAARSAAANAMIHE